MSIFVVPTVRLAKLFILVFSVNIHLDVLDISALTTVQANDTVRL